MKLQLKYSLIFFLKGGNAKATKPNKTTKAQIKKITPKFFDQKTSGLESVPAIGVQKSHDFVCSHAIHPAHGWRKFFKLLLLLPRKNICGSASKQVNKANLAHVFQFFKKNKNNAASSKKRAKNVWLWERGKSPAASP